MARKKETIAHRPGVTATEFALFCWLRRNPDVAASYGITQCNGETTIGSLLLQTLKAQGMDVDWFAQVPSGAVTEDSTSNEKAASFIKKVTKRPGARMKQLVERPQVAPASNAAVLRKGKLPKLSFPLLIKLSAERRKRKTTACGNRIAPPADVALIERQLLVDFVEKKLRCEKCSARLRFCSKASHQVAACAQWCFVCERGCKLSLRSSAAMHGDDYQLNSKLNYAIVTCALSFERMVALMRVLGMVALSTTDHYAFKAELEPILAEMAEVRALRIDLMPPHSRAGSRSLSLSHSARWPRRTSRAWLRATPTF